MPVTPKLQICHKFPEFHATNLIPQSCCFWFSITSPTLSCFTDCEVDLINAQKVKTKERAHQCEDKSDRRRDETMDKICSTPFWKILYSSTFTLGFLATSAKKKPVTVWSVFKLKWYTANPLFMSSSDLLSSKQIWEKTPQVDSFQQITCSVLRPCLWQHPNYKYEGR